MESPIAFVFRRDLRIVDNTGLIQADKQNRPVVPIFIFTKLQTNPNQPYFSHKCFQFLVECVEDLQNELRKAGSDLVILYGEESEVVKRVDLPIYTNLDYTPYSRSRHKKLSKLVDIKQFEDYMVTSIQLVKDNGEAYVKFTPYRRAAESYGTRAPDLHKLANLATPDQIKALSKDWPVIDVQKAHSMYTKSPLLHTGGRADALKQLNLTLTTCQTYDSTRNDPNLPSSQMSAYNKFGCVSVREVYKAWATLPKQARSALLSQLYWRDFYYQIAWHHPRVLYPLTYYRSFNPKYDKIKWFSLLGHGVKPTKTALAHLEAWKSGKTGFPIVDAFMRQLNSTGFMHNRGRLITSGFLIKHLHWHWEDGEKYFAQALYDYDPSQNSGGWQWSSGSGTDSQPYFRILSPPLQSEKFDPEAKFIKSWIPELKDLSPKQIHYWHLEYSRQTKPVYLAPIIDLDEAKQKTLDLYKRG